MHTIFFQWNIPAPNEALGRTDKYINVLATWDGTSYFSSTRPMVSVVPCDFGFYDATLVKDWSEAYAQIQKIATDKFAALAREEKLRKARELLSNAGESGNPVIDRFLDSVMPVKEAV